MRRRKFIFLQNHKMLRVVCIVTKTQLNFWSTHLTILQKSNRSAWFACPSSTSHSVNVIPYGLWCTVQYNIVNSFNIHTSCQCIRTYQPVTKKYSLSETSPFLFKMLILCNIENATLCNVSTSPKLYGGA